VCVCVCVCICTFMCVCTCIAFIAVTLLEEWSVKQQLAEGFYMVTPGGPDLTYGGQRRQSC